MTTDDAFLADIKRSPGDPVPLLIYADWLADQGGRDDEELACRWMARRGKHPRHRERYRATQHRPGGALVPANVSWAWYPEKGWRDDAVDGWLRPPPDHGLLPNLVFQALPRQANRGHERQLYPTWEDAFRALVGAMRTLREVITP